jgi:multidrug efflux system membrane fusion protein
MLGAVGVAVGLGVLWLVLSPGAKSATGAPAASPHPVTVTLATARARDIPVLLTNIGAVQAYRTVQVRARIDGTLNAIDFTEGQMVKAGDTLAEIDPRPYQAALDAAKAKAASDEAQLANARKTAGRDNALLKDQFASRQTFDNDTASVAQLEANIAGDEAAIDAAALNLGFTKITAPMDGRVGLRQVDPGNQIFAAGNTEIVELDQIQPITVLFSLPQNDLPAVQAAMQRGRLAVFASTVDSGTALGTGTLLTIDNDVDPATGTFRLKAIFPNANRALWPGLAVQAALQVQVLKNAVTVPSVAVNRGPDGLYVFAAAGGKVRMVPVQVRQDDGTIAVIASGIAAGTQVVADGQSKLQNGSRIVALATAHGA